MEEKFSPKEMASVNMADENELIRMNRLVKEKAHNPAGGTPTLIVTDKSEEKRLGLVTFAQLQEIREYKVLLDDDKRTAVSEERDKSINTEDVGGQGNLQCGEKKPSIVTTNRTIPHPCTLAADRRTSLFGFGGHSFRTLLS